MLFILFSGCEALKKGMGLSKDKPNEFLIEKRDPLVLPPDYEILPPDSKTVKKEKENSLKSVLDQSLSKNKEPSNSPSNSSSSLEESILKQIK